MAGRTRVATWIVTERRDRVYTASTAEENPLDERTSITVPIVSIDYRLTPRLGVQISTSVPFIARTGVVPRDTGAVSFRDEVRGWGDTVAGVWYRRGSPARLAWTVNAGMSMPTGATRPPRFREGLERPAAGGRWITSLAARTPLVQNRDGLRTGASWEVGSGWAHTVRTHRVMAYGRVDWLHREQDAFRGTPVLVGGGNWVYATPGMGVMIGKGINVQLDVKLPLYRRLANRQLDSRAIFQIGISRSF